jgi:DNA-binding HxlR family transcriptional regulator
MTTASLQEVVEVLARKWTVPVLASLSERSRRTSEIRADLRGVSDKVLTSTLRLLERDGLIHRSLHAAVPPRVEYTLTPLGQSLVEALAVLGHWASTNVSKIQTARENYTAMD